MFDPADLTPAQRDGDACVVCHKRWPRPRVRAGLLPGGFPLFACEECAPTLEQAALPAQRDGDQRRAWSHALIH